MLNPLADSTARLEQLLEETMKEKDPTRRDDLSAKIRQVLLERERLKNLRVIDGKNA